MTYLVIILLWLLIGDLLLCLRPWEDVDYTHWWGKVWRMWQLIVWPTSAWWVLRRFLREWRDDLYYRNKYR